MSHSLAAGDSQGAVVEGTRPVAVDKAAEDSPAEQGSLAAEGSLVEGSLVEGSLVEGSLVEAGRQGQAVWGNRHRAGGAVSLGRTDSLELASRVDSLELASRMDSLELARGGALRIERKTK